MIQRYETESAGKIEELEHAKMKLQARLSEAEETIEGLNSRCISLEKLKQRLTGEIDDLQMQMDSANQIAIALEKKAKNFDKVVAEWKSKVEELTQQLEEAQRENRYVNVVCAFHKKYIMVVTKLTHMLVHMIRPPICTHVN